MIPMMQRTPIRRKRPKPRVIHSERSGGHERVRLHGKAREQRRAEIFARSGGRCEERIAIGHFEGEDGNPFLPVSKRCPNRATEWSHLKHGPRKCDCMACGIASCSECHRKRHNPKPITVTKKSLRVATEQKDGER